MKGINFASFNFLGFDSTRENKNLAKISTYTVTNYLSHMNNTNITYKILYLLQFEVFEKNELTSIHIYKFSLNTAFALGQNIMGLETTLSQNWY